MAISPPNCGRRSDAPSSGPQLAAPKDVLLFLSCLSAIRIARRLLFVSFPSRSLLSAKPQWSNPNEFYSNSYQYQHGFVPQSAFGVNSQYGAQNTNFGGLFAFLVPVIERKMISFVSPNGRLLNAD